MAASRQTVALGAGLTFLILCFCLLYSFSHHEPAEADSEPPRQLRLHEESRAHNLTGVTVMRLPAIVLEEMSYVEQLALKRLQSGMNVPVTDGEDIFRDVRDSFLLHPRLAHPTDGSGGGMKYYASEAAIQGRNGKFIVYGAGNAGAPDFELELAGLGADVYSFDCTVPADPAWTSITFFPWCIGAAGSIGLQKGEAIVYTKDKDMAEAKFFTLREIKEKLGHKEIHLLKMDIEGFEWDLLQQEIIAGRDEDLPEQLLFELHGEGTTPLAVPVRLSAGKDRHAVNRLFIDLFHRNYRIMHWEVNSSDEHAAEFSLIRLPGPSSRHAEL